MVIVYCESRKIGVQIPSTHIKKMSVPTYTCNPSIQGLVHVGPEGSWANQSGCNNEIRVQ